jgi:quinoprotein glucose dehydrogenase
MHPSLTRSHPEAENWGVTNLGGAIATAGGLVFVAATPDAFFRAFDIDTGKQLWRTQLPAAAKATPMTYRLRPTGKQFVVIAAGGWSDWTPPGDAVVAFALP